MTDTPRTEEELLTIFEECQTHGISSQDMRDQLVSFTSPVGAGPFVQPFKKYSYRVTFQDGSTVLATLPTGGSSYGDAVCLPAVVASPAGHVAYGVDLLDPSITRTGNEPNAGWAGTPIAANSVFMLPQGVYTAEVYGAVSEADAFTFPADDPGPTSPFGIFVDQIQYDPDFDYGSNPPDGTEAWIYDAYFSVSFRSVAFNGGSSGDTRFLLSQGTITQDKPEPQPYAMFAYVEAGHMDDVHLTEWGTTFWRMSP